MSVVNKIFIEPGTVSQPGIVFRGMTATGLSATGGDISLSAAGVEKLKLSSAGILTLPAYAGNDGKYLKMDTSGVLSADTPAGSGSSGSDATYTGFAVKQDNSESAPTTAVYVSKVNKIITLGFEQIQVNLSATTNSIKTRIMPNNTLHPDMSYNCMTPVFINNKIAYARFATNNTDYCIEFITFPTLSWDAGAAIVIQPFTVKYKSLNSTALSGTTWGTIYVDTTAPIVSTLVPADNSLLIDPAANLIITFNETLNTAKGTGSIKIYKTSPLTLIETILATSGLVAISGTTVTINPATILEFSTGYHINIDGECFTDSAGNKYAGISDSTTWNFTTSTTTFLDGTSPSVALGLTRLLSSYTANKCVAVKNAATTIIDIGFVNNAFNVTAFNNHKAAGGGGTCVITIWYDQSGNGRDFYLTDGTVTNIDIFNGKPRAVFNASYFYPGASNSSISVFSLTASHSLYTVFDSVASTSQGLFMSPETSAFGLSMNNTGITYIHRNISVSVNEGSLNFNSGNKHFTEFIYNQSSGILTVGESPTNTVTNTVAMTGTSADGNLVLGYNPYGAKFTGNFYTCIIYNTALDTTKRNTIKNSLFN